MIRPARPADAAAICAIWNPVIRDTTVTFTTEVKDPATLARQIATQPFLVAETEGTVIGFVTFSQFRAGPGYALTMEHSVHVAEGTRGAGFGRALMEAAHARAAAEGAHSFIAGIGGENAGGVRFHSAIGYGTVARIPQAGHKFGRWHDLVLMQKFL